MELNKEYKKIYINPNVSDYDTLKGKVVEKISLANDRNNYDMNELIITFTDKTYIAFKIENTFVNGRETSSILSNSWIFEPECWNMGNFEGHVYVSGGKLVFDPLIDNRIQLGLWKLTMDEAQEIIKRDNKRYEEQDYKRYLYLKEKFSGREEEFRYLEEKK